MTNDLISRSALLEQVRFTLPIDSERRRFLADCVGIMRGIIIDAPAVDAVEVCRCKDCAWCKKPFPEHFPQKLECMRFDMEVAADEFCSRSERRDNA